MLDTSHSSLFGPTYALYRGSAAQVRIRWYYTVPLRSPHQITLQAMPTPKLLDQVRTVIRVRHFSLSTGRAYVSWIRRFILFHNKRHPMRWRKQKFASSFLILLSMQKSQHLRKRSRLALSFFFTVTCSSPSGAVPPIYEQIPRPFVLKVQCMSLLT